MANIVNIVQTYKIDPIPFTQVSKVYACVTRRKFRAVFIRFDRISLQLFENGTLNITGITSEEQGLQKVKEFCEAVGSSIKSYKITTITATGKVKLNFESLKRHPDAEYYP